MPLLTMPSRPKPPRMNKRRPVVARKDSQTTLREEAEEQMIINDEDHMEYDYAPPIPPKLDTTYSPKPLPITPMDSPLEDYHVPFQMHRAPTPPQPKAPPKTSTSNRWKSAMGKILTLRRPTQNTTTKPRKHFTPPPLSPASSRQPSFYVPTRRDFKPHKSAVTLLTSGSSTEGDEQNHEDVYYDEDVVTNIGLSRSSLVQSSPVTPGPVTTTRIGYQMDHLEPISSVLQRAGDIITVPSPITPYTPYSPVRRPPMTAQPSYSRPEFAKRRPSTPHHVYQHQQRPAPTPSPPPPVWPAPGSPPLIVANPTPPPPEPTPSPPPVRTPIRTPILTPSPSPILIKRSNTTRTKEVPRPKLRTNASAITLPPLKTDQKRPGPRILQAQLPSPVAPDPKKHVFTGPWINRRGDEWLGISAVPGEYRALAAKDDKAFDPKYLNYPEELHHFQNPMGDVMDAKTLGMVSKAARL